MKNVFYYAILLMLSFSLLSATCSSNDDDGQDPNNNSVVIAEVTATLQTGTWRITNFVDSGTDETNDFAGYNFTFNNNGTLAANNGSTTVTGTWSITNSGSSSSGSSTDDDGNSSSDVDFNIAFASPPDFAELTEDWHIVSHTGTRIVLIHISGGNGGTDNLTFELN